MPWSVAPLRLGRTWVLAPDAASLRGRWAALLRAGDEAGRAALFRPSRARTLRSAVAPLPGRPAHGARLAAESGPCPEPVRVLHGPYDQQWLLPDHRLIDVARPELWRVTDERQIHLVETAYDPRAPGVSLAFTALLPDGHSPAGRPGRVRPLHRRPGGLEPNLAPGLLDHLARRLEHPVSAEDVLAWTAATATAGPDGRRVPFTADADLWERGVALGRRSLWLHTRGERCGGDGAADGPGRPRLPGGQRPYVRAPLPARPAIDALAYDEEERALCVGEGRVSPVERAAWEYTAGGTRVLETWFARRAAPVSPEEAPEPGSLAAVRPREWPQEWTSELLELITVLTLLAGLEPELRELAEALPGKPVIGAAELREAGVLPPPDGARRPASVLDLREEGPEGQLALL
ncbi:type ISP restriction/modification enzyme [Streptomyces sp. NPDC054796]